MEGKKGLTEEKLPNADWISSLSKGDVEHPSAAELKDRQTQTLGLAQFVILILVQAPDGGRQSASGLRRAFSLLLSPRLK